MSYDIDVAIIPFFLGENKMLNEYDLFVSQIFSTWHSRQSKLGLFKTRARDIKPYAVVIYFVYD